MSFQAYMLRCADGTYYTGHTDDLDLRVAQHQSGVLSGYTHARRPVALVWNENFPERLQALEAERQIKGWSRAKKEALIRGDWAAISRLASRAKILRDAASTSSAAPQDKREEAETGPTTVRPEEGRRPVSKDISVSMSTSVPARPEEARSAVSKGPEPHPPAIVLVRPQLGENIGAVARAMLNFGLTDLRLVNPRDGWPNPAAGPAASGADAVLEGARVFASVQDAIADCRQVFATTVRRRELVLPVVTPEQAAMAMHDQPGPAAVLFGAERSGLETDEAALAGAILTIPVNPAFGSLNLAQAALVVAYEWSKRVPSDAEGGARLATPTDRGEGEPPAHHAELEGLITQFDGHLDAAGYYHPPDRTPATRRTLRTLLTKPGWSSREIRALRGMLRAVANPRPRVAAEQETG